MRHAQTKLSVLASARVMYQSFVVGSRPGGCRHPEQVGCRWTRQSVEASSGPGSCAGFCYRKKKKKKRVKGATKKQKFQWNKAKGTYKGTDESK